MKLKMDGICKSFGSNEVLKSVGFQLSEGEICALLGENGAGKSTLMNILGGVLQPDSGEILLDGQKRKFDSPAQSLDAGIAFIHPRMPMLLPPDATADWLNPGYNAEEVVAAALTEMEYRSA